VRALFLAVTVCAIGLAGEAALAQDRGALVVRTQSGPVRGVHNGAVDAFLGIAYGAPPVGDKRWRPPQPAESRNDIREAKAFGAYCAATKSTNGPRSEAEDCLFINVWRPSDVSADAKLPVYVFIHGGGFINGSSNQADMTEIVEKTGGVDTIERGKSRKSVANYIKNHDGAGDVDANGDDISDVDWDEWLQTHRVELNAMTTPRLIAWLDDKMKTFGAGKLIPPETVLEEDLKARVETKIRAEIIERILREAGLDAQVDAAIATLDLPDGEALARGIQQLFEEEPDAEWRAHIEAVADEQT
jgi:hypothetical protein